MKRRYEMWAGRGNPEQLAFFLDQKEGEEPFPAAVWPIVDNETCGPINMEPTLKQMLALTFSSVDQRKIYDALTAQADLSALTQERDALREMNEGWMEQNATLTRYSGELEMKAVLHKKEVTQAYNEGVEAAGKILSEEYCDCDNCYLCNAAKQVRALKR